MKCIAIPLSWLITLTAAGLASATDVPYGADSLPFLGHKARVVAEVVKASKADMKFDLGTSIPPSAYRATLGKTFKGKPQQQEVILLFPEALDLSSADQLQKAAVFLTPAKKLREPVTSQLPVYDVVGGRYGVIPLAPGREDAIGRYLSRVQPDSKGPKEPDLNWAKNNLVSSDEFLQRSAVMEVGRYARKPEAVTLLSEALRSEKTDLGAKRAAVNALQRSNSAEAVKSLRDAAENPKLPQPLRKTAVQAMGSLPGGMDQLRAWKNSKDDALKESAAQQILAYEKSHQGAKQ